MRRIALAGITTMALALGLAAPAGAVKLTPVGEYTSPVFVTSDPANPDRIFVVEQGGRIRLTTPAGTSLFLDLTSVVKLGNEQGLLSMAFAPDYATSGRFYVYYTGNDGGAAHVGELTASGNSADPATLRDVITISEPFPNHNGGQVAFGPDGHLYLATGDGGSANDPMGNGQKLSVLLGKVLRIDPVPGGGYTVPADNPFIGTAGARPEIWSYGLRNPFRFSFDTADGSLVIGDVGQNLYEEVDYAARPNAGRGVNYGWACREGLHDFGSGGCAPPLSVDPVLEYSHLNADGSGNGNCSITGGYVVHDPGLSELEGRYVYADFCKGQIRSAVLAPGAASGDRSEGLNAGNPSSFGQDSCGRIYVASLLGEVSRLDDATPTDCTEPPSGKRCTVVQRGSPGNDRLRGGPGGQGLYGRGGDDRLRGGSGRDCLFGGPGADDLGGGRGVDVLRGGRGRDVIHAADGRRDRIACGRGRDRVVADRKDRLRGCERVRRKR